MYFNLNMLKLKLNEQVIHGDIAARNILVFSPMTVKLTDFGLSRRLHNYTNYIMNTSVRFISVKPQL